MLTFARVDRRHVARCVLVGMALLALSACAGSATPAAAAQNETVNASATEPWVQLSLNGERVPDDGYRLIGSDPTVTVEAGVGADAANETTLASVEIQHDSRTHRSYQLDEETTTISTVVPLDRGNNTVRVIVADSADGVSDATVRIGKDDIPPAVGLTDPFESPLGRAIPNGTVDEAVSRIGVRTGDFSDIARGKISLEYEGQSNAITARDPGPRFGGDLLFGYGNNLVRITATDELGNTRAETFGIELVDETDPGIALDLYPDQTTKAQLTLSGTLTDNVWVREASVSVEHVDRNASTGSQNYTRTIHPTTEYAYSASGRNVPFAQELFLWFGRNDVQLTVTDHQNQTTERTFTIERLRERPSGENVDPRIRIDRNETAVRDGRVRLVATVSDDNWNLDRIGLETRFLSNGSAIDYERYSDLGDRPSVTLNTTLTGAAAPLVVTVRARDARDASDIAVLQLNGSEITVAEPNETNDSEPSESVNTTTAAPTTTRQPFTPTPETPTITSTPHRSRTPNGSTRSAEPGGLPVIGADPVGATIGYVTNVLPFVLGGLVFVVVSFFVLRRVRGGAGSAA